MPVTAPLPAPLPLDHAAGRAALRKASWRLIPLIALGYGLVPGCLVQINPCAAWLLLAMLAGKRILGSR